MAGKELDLRTLAFMQTLVQAANASDDWKIAMDKVLVALRVQFVFDNVAIYIVNPDEINLEIVHARAVGRGKAAEADAAWGENLANLVLIKEEQIIQNPTDADDDRLAQAYLLGIPLHRGTQIFGALVFIRFGGPVYETEQVTLANLAESWISCILNRKADEEMREQFKALEQKVQLQDDFVATISHELRTPLGFIKGYSTTLLRTDTSWDIETSKEFLTIIDEEADRLAQLIENILESAKLQSRSVQLSLQPVRVDALIRDVIIRVRARHNNLDVKLNLDSPRLIQGDVVRLTQVFDNLFSNAAKYASNSQITVSTKEDKDSILITFADQGTGIPKVYLPYIFERFYRVPGTNSSAGSGLGLYICNQIIKAHHGKIWVESELNYGTTFYIQLPVVLNT